MANDDFAQQTQARQAAEKLTGVLTSYEFKVDEIDYEQNGMDTYLTINGVDIGSLAVLSALDSNRLLEYVRLFLIVDVVQNYLGVSPNNQFDLHRQTPLPGTTGLWRVVLNIGADSALVVEYIRNGQRIYEAF